MLSLDTNNFLPNHHGCTAFLPIMNQSVHLLHKNELLIDEDSGLFILQSSSFSPESLSLILSSTLIPYAPAHAGPFALPVCSHRPYYHIFVAYGTSSLFLLLGNIQIGYIFLENFLKA